MAKTRIVISVNGQFSVREQIHIGSLLVRIPGPRMDLRIECKDSLDIDVEDAQLMPFLEFMRNLSSAFPDQTYWVAVSNAAQLYSMKIEGGLLTISLPR